MAATQQQALAQLKALVQTELTRVRPEYNDNDIARFLRARNYKVEDAAAMLRKHLQWYQEINVKKIVEDVENSATPALKFLRNYTPNGYYGGKDKTGAPVFYERSGVMDVRGMFKRANTQDFIHMHIWEQERALVMRRQLSQKLGKPMDSSVFIEDLQDLSHAHLYKPGLEAVIAAFAIDEAHYPETLSCLFVIRAPKIFTVIWSILKPAIDANTLAKIKIVGQNYLPELLTLVDSNQLPKEFGGSSDFPPLRTGGVATEDGKGGAMSVTVAARHEIPVDVSQVGTMIFYDFSTASHDIGFGVTVNGTVVEPIVRYDCSQEPVQGSITCKQTGMYALVFDNSYSLFRSKTVTFKVDAYLPQNLDEIANEKTQL